MGVIAVLTFLDVLVQHYNITEGSIIIALDGESTYIQSNSDWHLASTNHPLTDYRSFKVGPNSPLSCSSSAM